MEDWKERVLKKLDEEFGLIDKIMFGVWLTGKIEYFLLGLIILSGFCGMGTLILYLKLFGFHLVR